MRALEERARIEPQVQRYLLRLCIPPHHRSLHPLIGLLHHPARLHLQQRARPIAVQMAGNRGFRLCDSCFGADISCTQPLVCLAHASKDGDHGKDLSGVLDWIAAGLQRILIRLRPRCSCHESIDNRRNLLDNPKLLQVALKMGNPNRKILIRTDLQPHLSLPRLPREGDRQRTVRSLLALLPLLPLHSLIHQGQQRIAKRYRTILHLVFCIRRSAHYCAHVLRHGLHGGHRLLVLVLQDRGEELFLGSLSLGLLFPVRIAGLRCDGVGSHQNGQAGCIHETTATTKSNSFFQ